MTPACACWTFARIRVGWRRATCLPRAPAQTGGYFAGVLDEVRVWNVVRSDAQIAAARDLVLTSGTGLVAKQEPPPGGVVDKGASITLVFEPAS